jgi:hypothetical protein
MEPRVPAETIKRQKAKHAIAMKNGSPFGAATDGMPNSRLNNDVHPILTHPFTTPKGAEGWIMI